MNQKAQELEFNHEIRVKEVTTVASYPTKVLLSVDHRRGLGGEELITAMTKLQKMSIPGNTANRLPWRNASAISERSKLVVFINLKVKSARCNLNASGSVARVSIAMTHIVGLYLGGKEPIKNLVDDLNNITRSGKVAAIGDFNAHSPSWGAPKANQRGTQVEDWAIAQDMRQHIERPTWGRGDKESTLDLIFTLT